MGNRKIAMWSGPRNMSTVLMRSFSSRPDCKVVDEPFYAAYLLATGAKHPLRDSIIESQSTNAKIISKECIEGNSSKKIEYQKHMTHHMIKAFDRSFIYKLSNVFLIRSPEKVVKSLGLKLQNYQLKDTGFPQQLELFQMIADKQGFAPPVINADDLCNHPKNGLKALCISLGIEYFESMLRWSKGPHENDGVWGQYWYRSVNESTGFEKTNKKILPSTSAEKKLIEKATPSYETISNYKISF